MRAAAVLLAIGAMGLAAAPASARRAPVVVELFTAQGCVSCDTADALIARLAGRADTIALTWPVDYWDYLGWKDTFAQPDFTERQRAYERRFALRDVYTPQVVVDGASQASGDDEAAVEALVTKARQTVGRPPEIAFQHGAKIAIGAARRPRAPAEVWLVRYDAAMHEVEVKAGDHRGAKVRETNVVRQVTRLGRWTGHAQLYRAPPAETDGLDEVVIVQEIRGGPVIGARRRPLPKT
jgi:hypothetical protein